VFTAATRLIQTPLRVEISEYDLAPTKGATRKQMPKRINEILFEHKIKVNVYKDRKYKYVKPDIYSQFDNSGERVLNSSHILRITDREHKQTRFSFLCFAHLPEFQITGKHDVSKNNHLSVFKRGKGDTYSVGPFIKS
jgi:hypothetical protein